MINTDNFTLFGHRFYVCDTGITADSYQELLDKIKWCHSAGIYMDRIPLQGYTIATAIPYEAVNQEHQRGII